MTTGLCILYLMFNDNKVHSGLSHLTIGLCILYLIFNDNKVHGDKLTSCHFDSIKHHKHFASHFFTLAILLFFLSFFLYFPSLSLSFFLPPTSSTFATLWSLCISFTFSLFISFSLIFIFFTLKEVRRGNIYLIHQGKG